MCFSASASFTASAVLMPLGLYSAHVARSTQQKDYIPLALTPFFFGVQQLIEGLVWTGIDKGKIEPLTSLASLGFLFFAYCFWMIWIPWSAWAVSRGSELVYWGFIVLPLVALRDRAVRLFGILIFVSIFLTWLTYSKTFNSVWCFYCAVLSIIVLWIVNRPRLSRQSA